MKQFSWIIVLAAAVQWAGAYSLLGPNNEAYQTPANGYNPNANIDGAPIAPKNLAEEYRRNVPTNYYTIDETFWNYFGPEGVNAIEKAFESVNGLSISNLSAYSHDLTEFPLEATRVNYRAEALYLTDLKSTVMQLIMEQMGLAHPDRYTWTLHAREQVGPGPCPVDMEYLVIKRNFDPVPSGLDQYQSSSYVNGTLYTYRIVEYCQAANSPVPPLIADAVEFPVDPLATTFTAVAAGNIAPILYGGVAFSLNAGQLVGQYYTGLTRDDVGGLRYLMRSNNLNFEATGQGAVMFVTNNTIQLLQTSDLRELAQAAFVTPAGALQGQFPGLQVASTLQYFTNVVQTNQIFYFTNYPWSPAGAPATLVSANVVTTNVATRYLHNFANVVTNRYATNGIVRIVTTNISTTACQPWLPPDFICLKVTTNTITTNGVFGDYYLLPTNVCDIQIVATQLITAVTVNGGVINATNGAATNVFGQELTQTLTYTYNQYTFQVRTITCPENTATLRQGIERMRFVRRDYDSLLGTFFNPITNDYVMHTVTNNTIVRQHIRRAVTAPDIIFSAEDLAGGPGSVTLDALQRNIPFSRANTNGLAGPGTILNGVSITFNKVGDIFGNVYPGLGEDTQIPLLFWGSFDGSTNAPIVYPNGTSVLNLENQVLIHLIPAGPTLPSINVGVNYTNVFSGFLVNGGQMPYSWNFAFGSGGLPPGLNLNVNTGMITGVPTSPGVYDFVIQMTEAAGRFIQRPYTITVNP